MAMPNPPEDLPFVVYQMRWFKQRLENMEAAQMQQMAAAWITLENTITPILENLLLEIDEYRAMGQPIPVSKLVTLERYIRLQAQMQQELFAYGERQAGIIEAMQQQMASMGLNDAQVLLNGMFERAGRVDLIGGFDFLPVEAVQNMVGLAGDGSPLKRLIDEAMGYGAMRALDGLVEATALGYNPRVTAKRFFEGLEGGLNRAMVIARTEQLRVYRDAALQQYAASGVVSGYRRISARDSRVCPACLFADDGKIYPLDQPFEEHPQGRCAIIPIVPGLEPVTETGEEWFRQQPDGVQRDILGQGRYNLWKQGYFDLQDIVKRKYDDAWGGSLVPKSLSELMAAAGLQSPPPAPDKLNPDSLGTFEDDIRGQAYESAAAFDADGNLLLAKDGEKSAVYFTNDEIDRLLAANNPVMTHNHPSNSPFSAEDLDFSITARLKEMRAVAEKYTYRLRFADNFDYDSFRNQYRSAAAIEGEKQLTFAKLLFGKAFETIAPLEKTQNQLWQIMVGEKVWTDFCNRYDGLDFIIDVYIPPGNQ